MFEIEEKSKRKAKPHRRSRLFIGTAVWLVLMFIAAILYLIALATGIIAGGASEFERLSTPIPGINPAVAIQIKQTNAAATQFYLATTSPTATTPTSRP
jgi:hypothetical protein